MSSLKLQLMPGHVRGCTVSEPMYPRRSPPRSQHPTFGIFHRDSLRFKGSTHHAHRQTGKLQAQTLETPVTRCATASCSAKHPPLQAWRAHATDETGRNVGWREKTRPARPFQRLFREKTRPTRPKRPKLRRFKPAGRTFSRTARQLLKI